MNENNYNQKRNGGLDCAKLHEAMQRMVADIAQAIAIQPEIPSGAALKKAANCIGKLTHSILDLRQHADVLLEENRELYRQLEMKSAQVEAQSEEIAQAQEELQQWQNYYAQTNDLFAPKPADRRAMQGSGARGEANEKS